jgi:hypothetical protein
MKYESNRWGGISQVNPTAFEYTQGYNDTYQTQAYKDASDKLMGIRVAQIFATDAIKDMRIESLLDFGYGNGAFLDSVAGLCNKASGFDIASTDYHVGKKWKRVDWIDSANPPKIATFWDSLEHCVNPVKELQAINAEYVFLSLPYAPFEEEWFDFDNWHHKKPNEHLHHFNKPALINMMLEAGYKCISLNHNEDEVRKPKTSLPNILSGSFYKI